MTTAPFTDRLRPARTRRTVATILLAALALTVSGCADATDADPKPSSSSSKPEPKPTQSKDPQAAEKKAVLAAYDAMWVELMKSYRVASAKGTKLERYATLHALGQFELDLAQMKKNGTVIKGSLGHEAEATQVDTTAKQPSAVIEDCVDLSKWQTYDTKTKKIIPLPSNQPTRYKATAELERWDGHWMITKYTPHGERKC
ncbi:hypothetical protein [Streptomyces cavernicola]|uniref:Secreted protein/lipoprotein n=1 Tax=Streptomyces cavernicola TaxID=3043613 RepID=A0ABT6SJH9_9ACTN|nr:hypothetical protein [Streptomyces sp. B-S-A6]MDI3408346.1 hypothetical protein [Streptomyces sp. B-S-A6]